MSFVRPYAEKYQPNDVFYGLSKPRAALIKFLYPNAPIEPSNKTIDDFFLNLNYFDDPSVSYTNQFKSDVHSLVDHLSKHHKYNSAVTESGSENENIRRKCKGGLQWATVKERNVHFCLDEIIMQTVVERTYNDPQKGGVDFPAGKWLLIPDDKYRVYTNSELRWVYRNRNDPNVKKYVQFWLENQACAPPWEHTHTWPYGNGRLTGDELWKKYNPIVLIEPVQKFL